MLTSIPKVHAILEQEVLKPYRKSPILKKMIVRELEILRKKILNIESDLSNPCLENTLPSTFSNTLDSKSLALLIKDKLDSLLQPSLTPVFNAVGVSLQTNLGRSIFSEEIVRRVMPRLTQYLNIEYNLSTGQRSHRDKHISTILCSLFDCEDALVVNNNAASIILIIDTFCKNREVVVSRGELVEIGGRFRISEIIQSAGGVLKEVGSTNRTYIFDYESSISEDTALLLKVHKSNFAQIGFCSEVGICELIDLARKYGLLDYFDLGSGFMGGFECDEPCVAEIMNLNPSLVSFSGDKLLGGAQSGIILGKSDLIARLRSNPMYRALRIDKLSLLFLQEVLLAHLMGEIHLIPTLSQLSCDKDTLSKRARYLLGEIKNAFLGFSPNALMEDSEGRFLGNIHPFKGISFEIIPTKARSGGGSMPMQNFCSFGILIKGIHAKVLLQSLRTSNVVARTQFHGVVLDIFCLQERDLESVARIVTRCIQTLMREKKNPG